MALRRSFSAVLSFALLAPAIASAEPISIASGTARTGQQPLIGSGDFNLVAADGTVIVVHWPDFTFFTSASSCQGCQPGTLVSTQGRIFPTGVPVLGQAGPYPSGSVGGVGMLFDGNLVFTGGVVALPPIAPPEPDLLTLDVPFTFGGQLNGYTIAFGTVLPAFSQDLNGAVSRTCNSLDPRSAISPPGGQSTNSSQRTSPRRQRPSS